MCYSFKTSVISYTVALTSAIFALCTRQIVIGCLILAYAQMQLSEAMIWHGIDKNDIDLNKKGTKYGKYLLATHNIAIGVGILLSIIFISKRQLKLTDFIPVIVGTGFFLFIVFYYYMGKKYSDVTFPLKKNCNKDCNDADNRLKWPYPHTWYGFSYAISIILLIIWIKPKKSKIIGLVFFSLTLLLTVFIYPKTTGSVWCWSTSALAPILVFVNYYMIRNMNNSELLV
jgi:uncharacterized membrane protein